MIRFVVGNATRPEGEGDKLIAHVCNDVGAFGRGFALAIANRWQEAQHHYRILAKQGTLKLGETQFVTVDPGIVVANMIAQRGLPSARNRQPLSYAALGRCLATVASWCSDRGFSCHMPRIGTGYGGASWGKIEPLIESCFGSLGVAVMVYDLPAQGES